MVNWTRMEDNDTLKQDVQDWIKIIVETEADINPANDNIAETSKNYLLNDIPDKWFLNGSFGNKGQILRDLTNAPIKSDTDVLIIGVSTDASNAEQRYRDSSVDELKNAARQIFDLHEVVQVVIDGEQLDSRSGLKEVATDVIDVTFPENNVYRDSLNAIAGPTKLFCLAWALKVKFEPGYHEIVIISRHPPSDELGVNAFNQDVKYKIKVE